MTILYQTTFPTDEDPVGSPFAIKEGGLKVAGGLLQLVAQNTFSVIYDDGRSYPADHISEIVIDTLDNGDFGPAVCVSPSGLYFPINVNGSDIWLYKREGSFLQIGQWLGVNYPTTGARKVGIRTVLNGDGTRTFTLLINDVATGTDIVDDPAVTGTPALTGGKPGVSGYSGVWRIEEFIGSDTNVSTGPTVTGVDDTTPEQGSTLVITGTDFLATQGSGGVVIGGAAQVETAWSNTSITVTLDRGANKYGVSVNIVVTDNAAASSSPFALSSLQPQAGWAYVNIGTPATSGLRITAVGDLASGDQLAYDTVGGTVTVFSDGTFSVSGGTTEFDCELWTPGDGWGAIGTQTLTMSADIGQAVETDTALAMPALLQRTIGQPAETDSARPMAASQARTIGQASEADTAQAFSARIQRLLAQAAETDAAQPMTLVSAGALGQASETDAAQSMVPALRRAIGQPSETDVAQTFAAAQRRAIAQAAEADLAQPVAARVARAAGQAQETDAAQSMQLQSAGVIGQPAESDLAQPITAGVRRSIGQPAEADTAQPVTLGGTGATIGQAQEADAAQAFVARLLRQVGQAIEVDSAQPAQVATGRTIGQAAELDVALAMTLRQLAAIGLALELDLAQPLAHPGYGDAPSDFYRYDVPGTAGALRYDVPGASAALSIEA